MTDYLLVVLGVELKGYISTDPVGKVDSSNTDLDAVERSVQTSLILETLFALAPIGWFKVAILDG